MGPGLRRDDSHTEAAGSHMTPAALLATWFGVGKLKPAPGTWGSLAAVPLGWLLVHSTGLIGLSIAIVVVFAIGVWAAEQYEQESGAHDSSEVVIDEVVGQWIAFLPLTLLEAPLWAYMLSFGLFRLFDIWKPWPISYLDDHIGGGIGVMIDDVAAGFTAALILYVFMHFGMLKW